MKTYNNRTGGLFDGEPLKFERRSSQRFAQKIGETLRVIHGDSVSSEMVDTMWAAAWQATGKDGTPPKDWVKRWSDRADFAKRTASTLRNTDGSHVTPKEKDSYYRKRLTAIGREMIESA